VKYTPEAPPPAYVTPLTDHVEPALSSESENPPGKKPRGFSRLARVTGLTVTRFCRIGRLLASKHGALGLTNTLRDELRPKGIRVIALLPGATNTDIWNSFWPQAPRKKMMSPATVAAALVNAILLPPNATVETLEILPTAGLS